MEEENKGTFISVKQLQELQRLAYKKGFLDCQMKVMESVKDLEPENTLTLTC